MREQSFGEPFDFERRFAFGENGNDRTAADFCSEPRHLDENGEESGIAEPVSSLCPDCPICAMLGGDAGIVGGFFDDDGNRLDPDSAPLPSLCICCARRASESWEEEILCTLNRLDQAEASEFDCADYAPLV